MRKVFLSIILIMGFVVFLTNGIEGAEFCVSNAAQLLTALNTAAINGEDDIIKLVQGTYAGNFSFNSYEGHSITLIGGYASGCGGRELDPAKTVLDGNNSGTVLSIENSNGGDIYVEGLTITGGNSEFDTNGVHLRTGSVSSKAGNITLKNNIVKSNWSTWSGKGGVSAISFSQSGVAGNINIVNNIISGNGSEYGFEGGIWVTCSTSTGTAGIITMTNNTIVDNYCYDGGSGAYLWIEGHADVYNNIFWGNDSFFGPVTDIELVDTGSSNGYNNDYSSIKGSWTNSGGNINADPQFVGVSDYHLQHTSPCIDSGRNTAPGLPATDFEGDSRIIDGDNDGSEAADIGADEYGSPQIPIFDGHDFNGDGSSDVSVWRPSNGNWYINGAGIYAWGRVGDIPVNGDYNGDGTTDIAVWRSTTGWWYLKGLAGSNWGTAGDIPVPGNYDGDVNGTTDIAVWRPSNGRWYIKGVGSTVWGMAGDIPVPGDYDGDGTTEIAVWRPSNGRWYIKGVASSVWGMVGDIPVPGDFNGDGKTEIAVWRLSNGKWYIKGVSGTSWGTAGDIPTHGDYNGDGITDVAVWRPSNGRWYVKGIGVYLWGKLGDVPLVH